AGRGSRPPPRAASSPAARASTASRCSRRSRPRPRGTRAASAGPVASAAARGRAPRAGGAGGCRARRSGSSSARRPGADVPGLRGPDERRAEPGGDQAAARKPRSLARARPPRMIGPLVSAETDEALVERLKAGHSDALDALYERHAKRRFVSSSATLRAASPEDLVHDTFLRAVEGIDGFEPTAGPFRAWLFGIARHRAIDVAR